MANPYTAINAIVEEDVVNTFLSNMLQTANSYRCTHVSSGLYGRVFQIDVSIDIPNPFLTFAIYGDRNTVTSDNRYVSRDGPHFHRFCCKIVESTGDEQSLSFTNECKKQQDIYAKTNDKLNAVCLPLFFHTVVTNESAGSLQQFISLLIQPVVSSKYGIAFMPFSPNYVPNGIRVKERFETVLPREITEILSHTTDMTDMTDTTDIDGINEPFSIHIFETKNAIYSFCVVLSLVIRLFIAGYYHCDLHLGNIIVYDWPSSMSNEGRYFKPLFLLLDMGYSQMHGIIHGITDGITDYELFKTVMGHIIMANNKNGVNMITNPHYNWFSRVFMDFVPTTPEEGYKAIESTLNEDRCKIIFRLYQFYERYRVNFETRQLRHFESQAPGQIDNIRQQNQRISQSVHEYIQSLPRLTGSHTEPLALYNRYGGRRHLHSYPFTRNKSKKKRRSKKMMRRRKSQNPRRPHRKSRKRGRK